MKKLILVCFFLFAILVTGWAQRSAVEKKWSHNTAILMPSGKWESGIFQPLRIGLSDRLEINAHAIMLPLIPNAGASISLFSTAGIHLASQHSLSCPTPFLNFISRKGTGGLISPEFDFPFILSIHNSITGTSRMSDRWLLSGMLGYTFALRGSRPDMLSTIDLPLFYPRMAHYYKGSTLQGGFGLKGTISQKWFFEQNLQAFLVTRNGNNFFAENNGTLMWAIGRSLRLRGGYVLTYGGYPFGKHWQMWPTFDVVFGSRSDSR